VFILITNPVYCGGFLKSIPVLIPLLHASLTILQVVKTLYLTNAMYMYCVNIELSNKAHATYSVSFVATDLLTSIFCQFFHVLLL